MSKATYYSGTEEVKNAWTMPAEKFNAVMPGQTAKPSGGAFWVGYALTGSVRLLPITRIITYKRHPKMHKCDARCRHAKGGSCECECGGQFHGAGD